jgi:hypothetical protein
MINFSFRVLIILILLITAIPTPMKSAEAYACANEDPEVRIARADAAFVGRVVARNDPPMDGMWSSIDPVYYTFLVESVAKGDLADFEVVWSPVSGASCGFEGAPRRGGRTGILLRFDNDVNYTSGLCNTMSPDDLASVAEFSEPRQSAIHQWMPMFTRSFLDAVHELLSVLERFSTTRSITSAHR